MKSEFLVAATVGTLALVCSIASMAQDTRIAAVAGDKYIISANAGGVNFISGSVSIFHKSGTSGYLVTGDEIQIGDRVTTGADGRAEILLNPGSYMRIGGKTSFEFLSTDLEDLKVSLKTGSAIFEVYAADDFRVTVQMPQSKIDLTRSGVFRLDVAADGSSKIAVYKGKTYVGPAQRTEVASGRTASLTRAGVAVSKFDRDTNDPLDIWSKQRAKELMKVNASLQRNSLRNTLLSSFNQRGWNMYNSFGLWVFNPSRRMWCFLPFGYGWGSPYGWGYDYDIWSCRLPGWIYREPYYPSGTGGSGGGSGGGGTTGTTTIQERRRNQFIPPFLRVQSTEVPTGSSGSTPQRDSADSRGPVYTPPPSSQPPVSTPPIVVMPQSDVKGKPKD